MDGIIYKLFEKLIMHDAETNLWKLLKHSERRQV